MRIVRHRLPPEPLSASRGLLGLGLSSSSSSLGRHGLGGGGGGFGVGGVFGVGAGGEDYSRPAKYMALVEMRSQVRRIFFGGDDAYVSIHLLMLTVSAPLSTGGGRRAVPGVSGQALQQPGALASLPPRLPGGHLV